MPKLIDLSGQRFGFVTVVKRISEPGKHNTVWLCLCDCGTSVKASTGNLRNGGHTSCGNRAKHPHHFRHGKSRTPEHAAYIGAKGRCNNPRRRSWKDYGGRGIEFRFKSFEEFYAELGPRPTPEHSVDRIRNNGHYEPGNVRWATDEEQQKNKRRYTIGVNWRKEMNIGHFIGRIGGDAELRYTSQGKAVTSFSLAVDQGKDGNGQKKPALWLKAVLWEKRAESLQPYLKKGTMVAVSGPVGTEAWISSQNGEAQSKIVVTVREFTFCGGGEKNTTEAAQPAPADDFSQTSGPPLTDEDIPF